MSRKYRLLDYPAPTVCIVQSFDVVTKGGKVSTLPVTIRAQTLNGKLTLPVLESTPDIHPSVRPQIDEWARRHCGLATGASLFSNTTGFDPKNLSVGQRLDMIADITFYGVQWNDGLESGNADGLETVAHVAACCLCQWFSLECSVGTAETLEALDLEEYPSREAIRESLNVYLTELQAL